MNSPSTHHESVRTILRLLLAIGFAAFAWRTFAAPTFDTSRIQDADVRACVERALPQHTMRQNLTVQVIDSTEAVRESNGTLDWKRFDDGLSKLLVRIVRSPQYTGVAVLMIERNAREPEIYVYSPELRRDRRVSSGALAGSLLGTDFTYEDFAFVQHLLANGRIERKVDADLDGHAAYVLETVPDEEASAYSRIRTYVDKAECVPVKTEFYGRNGSLDKQLDVERAEIKPIAERWVPMRMVMVNHKDKSRTVLVLNSVEFDQGLPDNLFNLATLRAGH